MNTKVKGISVACADNHVYVQVVGRGTFQNSQPLRRFALEMIEQGQRVFTVNIADCPNMDSTFLGVLAGIGLRLQRETEATPGRVQIVNVSPRNLELIQTLGLDRLFEVSPSNGDAAAPPAGAALQTLPESDVEHLTQPLDKNETTNLMLQAHDSLIKADERNAPKFRSVTKFLRETLERRRGSGSDAKPESS